MGHGEIGVFQRHPFHPEHVEIERSRTVTHITDAPAFTFDSQQDLEQGFRTRGPFESNRSVQIRPLRHVAPRRAFVRPRPRDNRRLTRQSRDGILEVRFPFAQVRTETDDSEAQGVFPCSLMGLVRLPS